MFTEFDGHCTFVASCILQQAPAATLYLRHVLDHRGDGTVWEAAAGIAELISLDLDLVNLSFGEYMTDDDSAPMVLDAAIRRFGRDTVVVAAAGNNGDVNGSRPSDVPAGVTPSTTSYPAALPEVVGVGAIDADDKRAPFTPRSGAVDLAAGPGYRPERRLPAGRGAAARPEPDDQVRGHRELGRVLVRGRRGDRCHRRPHRARPAVRARGSGRAGWARFATSLGPVS